MTEKEYKALYGTIETNMKAEYEPKIADLEKVRLENRGLKLDSRVKELFKLGGAKDEKAVNDFWKLHSDEFDLSSDGKPVVKAEPGKDVNRHVQAIMKNRPEWVAGTKGKGGRDSSVASTTPAGGLTPGGLSFEDLLKNPAAAIAVANEGQ